MKAIFKRFRKNEDGATAIEYGLIAALISVIIIAVMGTFDGGLRNAFTTISNALKGVAS
jgi:pilus assembly protein Flp/PilA